MLENNKAGAFILGIFVFLGLSTLGFLLGNAAHQFKQYDRSVTVKGLSEHELNADRVLWPIQFTTAGNDLEKLYTSIDENTAKIQAFLGKNGVTPEETTVTPPSITDKSAQQYNSGSKPEFRYAASQTVTVYSTDIDKIRSLMSSLTVLGKEGIVFARTNYELKTEYFFTRLNEVKPEMIEEATRKAREVAEKFASDSRSKLGKIKKASQGQFSISNRDKNNPHIKKVRVVSTVEYYLSD